MQLDDIKAMHVEQFLKRLRAEEWLTLVLLNAGDWLDIDTIRSMARHVEADMTRHYLHVQDPIRKDAVTHLSDTLVDFNEEEE